jgi:hypothetical protein
MPWPVDTYDDDIEQHVLALSPLHQTRMARLVLSGWRFRPIEAPSRLTTNYVWRWQALRPALLAHPAETTTHLTLELAVNYEWDDETNKEITDVYNYGQTEHREISVHVEPKPSHSGDVPERAARGRGDRPDRR